MSPAELQLQVREALALLQRGDAAAADSALKPALRAAAHDPNVRQLAALIRRAKGDLVGALADYDAALAAAPNAARMHLNRAALLADLGRHEEALAGFDAAARLGVDNAALWGCRGAALSHLGRNAEAIAALDRALALDPNAADERANRARALLAEGRHQDAIADYDILLQRQPGDAGLWDNRGVALFKLDRLDEAEASLAEALRLRPDHTGTLSNLGLTLFGLGRTDEAIAAFDRALALDDAGVPATAASLRYNRGMAFLARGDFDAGWEGLEARWAAGMVKSPPLDNGEPAWRGGPVDGRLRIWPEQGIGDQILFARLAPLARERAGRVVLGCEARLAPLFARSFPQIEIAGEDLEPNEGDRIPSPQGEGVIAMRSSAMTGGGGGGSLASISPSSPPVSMRFAHADTLPLRGGNGSARSQRATSPAAAQCAIGSLGAVMGAKREHLGGGAAFLHADPRAVEDTRARYTALARGRPIVGIAWASAVPGRGEWKTAVLSQWRPLLERDRFFVSLQYGETGADIAAARAAFGVEIHVDASIDQLQDLDAFAAQVAALDHVVSVSNTTVHMAGALGVDCIVMPPPARGRLWYWSIEGETTPWYASVRIVRRRLGESWETQIARAAALLESKIR